jgi:hypothetical protein
MAEGAKDDGLKDGRFDRLLSLTAVITGAAGVLSIVFACFDWSHTNLTVTFPSANLLLFMTGLSISIRRAWIMPTGCLLEHLCEAIAALL